MQLEIVKTYSPLRTIERAFLIADNEQKTEINIRIADTWLARHPMSIYPRPFAYALGQRIYRFDIPPDDCSL